MKTSLHVLLIALLIGFGNRPVPAQPQRSDLPQSPFRATSWQVGLKDGYGPGHILNSRNSLQLHAGYFVVDRLAVGVNATWTKEWTDGFGFHDFTAGPYARYQFTTTWFSPFLETSYQVGRRKAAADAGVSYPSIAMQSAYLNPGVSFRLLSSLRLDLGYAFQWVFFSGNGNPQVIGQPQLGFTYLFP